MTSYEIEITCNNLTKAHQGHYSSTFSPGFTVWLISVVKLVVLLKYYIKDMESKVLSRSQHAGPWIPEYLEIRLFPLYEKQESLHILCLCFSVLSCLPGEQVLSLECCHCWGRELCIPVSSTLQPGDIPSLYAAPFIA